MAVNGETITSQPEVYLRAAITKNTKGYNGETTVSVRGAIDIDTAGRMTQELLITSDAVVRLEIARREALDAKEVS